jgi:NADH dehydrogenase
MQQGKYVARLLEARWRGETEPPFRYRDRGNLATIGRSAAVAHLGRYRFGGFFAWVLWLFIHLIYLIGFDNKLLVLFQWAWNYFTWNRNARLITGPSPLPLGKGADPVPDAQRDDVP